MQRYGAFRQSKDPAALTPYEQQIWNLRQQGLTNQEIGEALNQLPGSIASRIKVIKEKVELQDALRMVG
jgi:DNA-binding NarL/FixJ family response regulator